MRPNGWDGITYSIANGIPLGKKYLNIIFQIQLVTMTLQKPTSQFTQARLIFSQEDSLVNHTQAPESDLGKPMKDISFRKCYDALKRSNQDTSWARMFVDSLVGGGGGIQRGVR